MPLLNIFNRDDELRPHISSRTSHVQPPRIGRGRLRLGKRAGQPAGRAKAVGAHRPIGAQKSSGGGSGSGMAIVKSQAMSPGRANGYSQYMTRDKDPERAADGYSRYMTHDRAELFNAHGPVSEEQRQAFVEHSRQDERVWSIIVSPQRASEIDLPLFAKTYMAQMEADCNIRFEYLAACHYDKPTHHHIHLLVRGRDAATGLEYRFQRDYLAHGMREATHTLADEFLTKGRAREQALAQVRDIAHSRTVEPSEAQTRVQEHLDKWKQGNARALAGRQRSSERDQGLGW